MRSWISVKDIRRIIGGKKEAQSHRQYAPTDTEGTVESATQQLQLQGKLQSSDSMRTLKQRSTGMNPPNFFSDSAQVPATLTNQQ